VAQISTQSKPCCESRRWLPVQVMRDVLTGLYNPRYLMDSCDRERHRARRRNERLGVMMRRRAD